jgi:hypothetical protein
VSRNKISCIFCLHTLTRARTLIHTQTHTHTYRWINVKEHSYSRHWTMYTHTHARARKHTLSLPPTQLGCLNYPPPLHPSSPSTSPPTHFISPPRTENNTHSRGMYKHFYCPDNIGSTLCVCNNISQQQIPTDRSYLSIQQRWEANCTWCNTLPFQLSTNMKCSCL